MEPRRNHPQHRRGRPRRQTIPQTDGLPPLRVPARPANHVASPPGRSVRSRQVGRSGKRPPRLRHIGTGPGLHANRSARIRVSVNLFPGHAFTLHFRVCPVRSGHPILAVGQPGQERIGTIRAKVERLQERPYRPLSTRIKDRSLAISNLQRSQKWRVTVIGHPHLHSPSPLPDPADRFGQPWPCGDHGGQICG